METRSLPRHFMQAVPIASGLLAAAGLALFILERRRPLRRQTQPAAQRIIRNLAMGTLSLAVVQFAENPIVRPLAARTERRGWGLAQLVRDRPWLRDLLAILLLDYTIYLWHVGTHRLSFLWRFHVVHHLDLDLDSTTALRFHAGEMLVSVPYRAAQIVLLGVGPRALSHWQRWFFLSVLFHHSNLRLPRRVDRFLSLFWTTPRMHGIHHSAVREETNSNWSSGLSVWDRLHGTLRLDLPQHRIAIGVPAYRDPDDITLLPSITMPFRRQRNAWIPEPSHPE